MMPYNQNYIINILTNPSTRTRCVNIGVNIGVRVVLFLSEILRGNSGSDQDNRM